MVHFPVHLLPVDVLQDIKAWHPVPPSQGGTYAFIIVHLWKHVVLNEEHADLQNVRVDGVSTEVGEPIRYILNIINDK